MSRTGEDPPVVELQGVWRRYRRSSGGRAQTLRASVALGRRAFRHDWFWALQGVDLAVRRGQATAVIGRNGAGKSTLLRLAGGVGRPDRGTVRVEGRIGALLELGHEFHPDLTGRRNAELAAVVAGLTRREFRERFEAMIDFAGLHDFADEPLHAYSDGMRARLAFSVLAHVEPDVLLVDEVLAVGDAPFQQRSVEHIGALRTRGTAVIFVSHDLDLVRRVCDEAVWLEGGQIRHTGDAVSVVAAYAQSTAGDADADEPASGDGTLQRVALMDPWGQPTTSVRNGRPLTVACKVRADPDQRRRRVSLKLIRQGHQVPAVDTSTTAGSEAEEFEVGFERLDLAPGRYAVVVAVFDHAWTTCLDDHQLTLDVEGEGPELAVLAPPHEWRRRRP